MSKEKLAIVSFHATNAKRLDAVSMTFNENGATVIGGSNGQGKTSVLDLIMSAILGKKYTPTNPIKEGHERADVKVELNNGVIVRRKFENGRSTIKVEGCSGSSQQFLNDLFGENALDVREFMKAKDKKKGEILMKLIGIDFTCLDAEHLRLYEERTNLNREEKRLKQLVDSLPVYEGVGTDEVSTVQIIGQMTELGQEQSNLLSAAASHEDATARWEQNIIEGNKDLTILKEKISALEREIVQSEKLAEEGKELAAKAKKELKELDHYSKVEAMKTQISGAEETNTKVRANREKVHVAADLLTAANDSKKCDEAVKDNRAEKVQILSDAKMPVAGLSVDEGLITFRGLQWDSLSTAEQFMIGTAVQAAQNPDAPIVLLDHMEAFDEENLRKYSEWCAKKEFQIIGTRVSTGSECTYVIEDGNIKEQG